jgi:Glycosyltransferase sugar-binding region containing DXD motif
MKIHFVWLGKNQGAHCTATAMAVAQLCPKDEVWLWVLKAHANDFRVTIQGSGVQIQLIDSVTGPLGAQYWVKDAFSVITTLVHYNAWAAAKDLAVLLIMYKYGGLYMDTTCLLATDAEGKRYESNRLHGVKARSLPKAAKALAKSGPALPLVKDDTIDYQPGAYSPRAITIGYDFTLENQYPILNMPHIDVWSYFSPVEHLVFLGAAQSYVNRAKILGLNDPNSPITIGKKELEGDHRDELIGKLIIHSVYDGLDALGRPQPEAILKICWQAFRFKERPTNLPNADDDQVNADIVPELGIIKQYKNTWKKKT